MLVALTYIKEEQERHENLATVLHRSATCYENARDQSTVSENALLWCYAYDYTIGVGVFVISDEVTSEWNLLQQLTSQARK
jgi:hypothetical protein